jgi:hypothetical protein
VWPEQLVFSTVLLVVLRLQLELRTIVPIVFGAFLLGSLVLLVLQLEQLWSVELPSAPAVKLLSASAVELSAADLPASVPGGRAAGVLRAASAASLLSAAATIVLRILKEYSDIKNIKLANHSFPQQPTFPHNPLFVIPNSAPGYTSKNVLVCYKISTYYKP